MSDSRSGVERGDSGRRLGDREGRDLAEAITSYRYDIMLRYCYIIMS